MKALGQPLRVDLIESKTIDILMKKFSELLADKLILFWIGFLIPIEEGFQSLAAKCNRGKEKFGQLMF